MAEPKTQDPLPDLAKGVPAADIAEGGKLVGQVGDDEVLVARIGGELLAIGARCTHYQGPLGEGLIVGDTVRCPWHHAHFCLRTGEALAGPAIDPVKRWTARETEGVVRVEAAAEAGAARKRARPASRRRRCCGGRASTGR